MLSASWKHGVVRCVPVLALALLSATIAGAQDEAAPESEVEAEVEATRGVDELLGELLQDDLALGADAYSYDPGGRRDPFKSLLVIRQGPRVRGPRPEGIPGLLIDEVDLTGIFVTASGPVAQVQSTQEEQSHLLREGDQLYDGDVVSISGNEVVFKQIVDDPTAMKPFREVVKKLNP